MNTVIAVLSIAAIVFLVSLVTVMGGALVLAARPAAAAVARAARRAFAFEPWTHDVSLSIAGR